jgi:adenylate kinase
MDNRNVILLTGVPGVGKTKIACSLAEALGCVNIDLSAFTEIEGLVTSYDERRNTSVADLEKLKVRLAELTREGEELFIIEGHFASDVIPPEKVKFAFVLRKAPWELKKVLVNRHYHPNKIKENLEAELLGVCLVDALDTFEPKFICEMDTTGKNPEELVKEILAVIKKERVCSHGRIDWLGHSKTIKLMEDMTKYI